MSSFDPRRFPASQPHGPLQEIAPDVWFVGGSMRMRPMLRISRNMVVVRSGDELTLVNPIRLDTDGEATLEALGNVTHAVRLGPFHGYDDAYTVARFGARFWSQPGSTMYPEPQTDEMLTEAGPLPIRDATLLAFEHTKKPECVLLLRRAAGILLTCDSLQHYGDFSRHSLLARVAMPLLGFRRSMVVGPLWLKMLTRRGESLEPDFHRLLELSFDALVSAHGTPLMHGAKAAVRAAVARAEFNASS